ncbi:strictosidine synthase [Necator americanus]|uniref:Strictosidine synthase n=1 Tax=Necator americanus TaxID=51031 RepID=W2SNU0_NECAM|nr:strictosidine synthase [Necator americanus]ETN71300.1 strictosidine synthase [Necator americanus]
MCLKVSQLFFYGGLGLLISWVALVYRYNDPSTRTTQLYELPLRPVLEGPTAVNEKLQKVEYILKDKIEGPESLVVEGDSIYTGLYDGRVVHIKNGKIVKEVRFTKQTKCGSFETEPLCGRPLGIRRLNKKEFVVADAYLGIFVVDLKAGTFRHLVKSNIPIEGRYMKFVNDVEVLDEDTIVFTDSSSRWDRRHVLHIILEHEATGRIFKHKISTGETTVLVDNLFLPNGIQLHPDGRSILFAECNMARIGRLNLKTNEVIPFALNLPGLPDNIRPGADSTLWVGMAGVRHSGAPSMIDAAGPYPLLRQIFMDFIPESWWIKYVHMVRPRHAMVIQLNADGEIVQSLHDTKGANIQDVSQVSQEGDYLYFGSFHNKYIARLYIGK